jgi:multiple sugar transport system substrate-binding protein
MQKRQIALVTFLLCVATLFSMSFVEAARITVMSRDLAERWQPLFDAYSQANPETSIEYLQVSGGQEAQRIIVLSAGGVPPDVALWMLGSQYVELVHNNLLADITDQVDRSMLPQLYEGSVELAIYRDRLYGLPIVNGTMGILYSLTQFNESGLGPIPLEYSWDDFLTYARRTTRTRVGEETPYIWGFTFYHYLRDYMNFVWTNGGDLFNKERTRFVMDNPAATEALQFLADMALVHEVSPRSYSAKAAWNHWYEGSAAMYPVGSWGIGSSRTRCEFDWDIATFPMRKSFSIVNDPFMAAVTSGSKHIDESVRLLKWLVFDEAAQAFMSATGLGIPARKSVARRTFDDPRTPQNEGIFLHMLNSGLPRIMPYTANWTSVQNAIHSAMAGAFAGNIGAAQAMDQVAPVIDSLLAEL